MVNLNMEDTIQQSILSIYNQLDESYEILVVDGGSSDASIEKIKHLQFFIKNLRLVELKRDKKRLLGNDRNTSIIEAKGEYVLLHLDCDDIYTPHIKTWVKSYHILEKIYGDDYLIMGKHINMAKRKTLIDNPYKNLQSEDRELWIRFLLKNKLIEIDHVDIAIRLKKNRMKVYHEAVYRTFRFCLQDLENYPHGFIKYFYNKIFTKNHFTLRMKAINILLMPFIFIKYILRRNHYLNKDEYDKKIVRWRAFKENKTSLQKLVTDIEQDFDFSIFNEFEKKIFKIK